MDSRFVQMADVEIPGRPSSENEADSSFVPDFVELSETLDCLCRLIPFPPASRKRIEFMDLSVVTAYFLLGVEEWKRRRVRAKIRGR